MVGAPLQGMNRGEESQEDLLWMPVTRLGDGPGPLYIG